MNTEEILNLFKNSTALIIDDQIYDLRTRINKLKTDFEKKGISFVCYDNIPDNSLWASFDSLSFVIVDWSFNRKAIDGVELGPELIREQQQEVVQFIEFLINRYFMPIFIFSQEHISPIKDTLAHNSSIKTAMEKKQIVIKSKKKLSASTVEDIICEWCKYNPAVYTLKILDTSLQKARQNLLSTLNAYDNEWPLIVYQTLKKDESVEINEEFSEFLLNALIGRIPSILYDESIMGEKLKKKNRTELIELYSKAKVVSYDQGQPLGLHTGDIYEYIDNSTQAKYYIVNITARCDLRKKKMLLLKGRPITLRDKDFDPNYGLIERKTSALVPSFLGNECVEFRYDSYFTKKLVPSSTELLIGENQDKKKYIRVGKLVHPYITLLQEGYSHFICRHGMTRHPDEVFSIAKK